MIDKQYAPGCFGSALTFQKDDICKACPFAAQCEPIHIEAKAELQRFLGVTAKEPTRKDGETPLKVLRLKEQLGKTEQEVREAMTSGVNPYPVSEGFAGVICHLILRLGETTRPALEKLISAHRNLNHRTASTYTRQTLQLLEHCKAISIDGQTVKLLRG